MMFPPVHKSILLVRVKIAPRTGEISIIRRYTIMAFPNELPIRDVEISDGQIGCIGNYPVFFDSHPLIFEKNQDELFASRESLVVMFLCCALKNE